MNSLGTPTARIAAATLLSGAALVAVGLAAVNTPARADATSHSIVSKTGATGQTTVIAQCPAGDYATGGGYNTADVTGDLSVIRDVQDNNGTAWEVVVSAIGNGWMTVSAECTSAT